MSNTIEAIDSKVSHLMFIQDDHYLLSKLHLTQQPYNK